MDWGKIRIRAVDRGGLKGLRGQDVRVTAYDPIGGGAELALPVLRCQLKDFGRRDQVVAVLEVTVADLDLAGVEASVRIGGLKALATARRGRRRK
jgi:hypothetical protein